MVPFAMLLMLMLHQTDDRELLQRCINTMAIGIRRIVSDIPVIAGIFVLPQPKKAPVAISSTHIKIWENPRMVRYSLPIAMLSASLRKMENNVPEKTINMIEVMSPIVEASNIPERKVLHCLS